MFLFSTNKSQKTTSEAGFSLIEAMVAIAIFAIGILGAYKMQLHSTKSIALANRVSTSASWAGYAVEELLGKPYNHVDFNDDGGGAANGSSGLDVMDTTADGTLYIQPDGSKQSGPSGNDLYSLYWNIVEGGDPSNLIENATTKQETGVLVDAKQIRVHVVRNGGIGNGHLYSHDYFKALYPE